MQQVALEIKSGNAPQSAEAAMAKIQNHSVKTSRKYYQMHHQATFDKDEGRGMGELLRRSMGVANLGKDYNLPSAFDSAEESCRPAPAYWAKLITVSRLLNQSKVHTLGQLSNKANDIGGEGGYLGGVDDVQGDYDINEWADEYQEEQGYEHEQVEEVNMAVVNRGVISRVGAIPKKLVIGAGKLDLGCLPADCGSLRTEKAKDGSLKCTWTETEKQIIANFYKNTSSGCYNKHVECVNYIVRDKDLRVHFHPRHLMSSANLRQGMRQWQKDKADGLEYTME